MFGLQLNHYDINFMYSLCSNIDSDYYLKTRDNRVRLISCLPDTNKNLTGEFVRVSGKWFAEELPYAFKPRDVGRSRVYFFTSILLIHKFQLDWVTSNQFLYCFCADTKRFKKDLRVVHVQDLNFVLRSEIFMHWGGQLRASLLILGIDPMYSTWQVFGQALLVDSPLVRDRAPGPFYEYLGQTHVNGWSHVIASQNGGSTDYISPLRLGVLQWSRHLFNYLDK